MEKMFYSLLELQKIDKVIYDYQNELAKIPQEISKRRDIFAEKEKAFEDITIKLEVLKNERDEREAYIENKKELILRKEEKLYMLKTYKEFNETQKEITVAKKEIKDAEDNAINNMEEFEKKSKEYNEIKESFSQFKDEFDNFLKDADEKMNQYNQIIGENNLQREVIAKDIDKNILRQYDMIRSKRNGVAVTLISSGTCSGCFMKLPPQLVIEIRKRAKIIQCPSCQRILIWNENIA